MQKKKKTDKKENILYSKNDSFENLEAVQQMALNRKGKDDEISPDISVFLKAEELKGKLCGLYNDNDKTVPNINVMGKVVIDGNELQVNVGESPKAENTDDRIT